MLTFRRRGGSFVQQHRKTWVLPALLCIGLAGCGTKDDSAYKAQRFKALQLVIIQMKIMIKMGKR